MSVETLSHLMDYAIEGWMLASGAYLTVGFTRSFIRRMRADIAAEARAKQAEAQRLAAVAAVAQQHKKTPAETVSVSVTDS